jgi:hypothetical protein
VTKKMLKEAGNKNPVKPQKYAWTQKKIFDNFNEADLLRNKLAKDGSLVKIRRCGPKGVKFKVVVGKDIKTNKKIKGEKNASK